MENRQKILKIVHEAKLSSGDANLWETVLNDVPEILHADILDSLERNPASLITLTENMKGKMAAVKSGDIKKWEEILEKEKTLFNK